MLYVIATQTSCSSCYVNTGNKNVYGKYS